MKVYKILFILCFSCFAFLNLTAQNSKTLSRAIQVNSNVIVDIDNRFGDVKLTSWDQDKVEINILIKVEGNNTKKVADKLEDIDVIFDLQPHRVSAKTLIDTGWGGSWFNNVRFSYRIDYDVKLPRKAQLVLKNDYGSVLLNALEGPAKIHCDYGKLLIGELLSEDNEIYFDYTRNSTFDFIKGGKINADYSSFEVSEAGSIDLIADYTNADFVIIQNLDFQNDYGKLEVSKANTIEGKGDFLTLKIGTLFNRLTLNNEFGSIKVEHIMPAVKTIDIDAEYTGIQLGIDPDWAFDYKINLEFASLKDDLFLTHKIQHEKSLEKSYQGFYKSEQSNNTLSINSEFGNVKINPLN